MRSSIRISSLVPSGLAIESVSDSADSIILTVRSEVGGVGCPLCGARSRRIHSRYVREVADLPCTGRQVRLRMVTRRFVCEVPHCRRRIFAERFGERVVAARSRRTARLEYIVHHLGLALGGRPAAALVSTPEQKCIGWPEQKYISDAGKKAPELGAFCQASSLCGIIRRGIGAGRA